MLGSVSRGAPKLDALNERYLRLPLDGGRALVRSRSTLSLTPDAVLRTSLLARWDSLARPMSAEDAVMELEASEDELLVFREARTERINVLFRQKDGNYGLIDPDS